MIEKNTNNYAKVVREDKEGDEERNRVSLIPCVHQKEGTTSVYLYEVATPLRFASWQVAFHWHFPQFLSAFPWLWKVWSLSLQVLLSISKLLQNTVGITMLASLSFKKNHVYEKGNSTQAWNVLLRLWEISVIKYGYFFSDQQEGFEGLSKVFQLR